MLKLPKPATLKRYGMTEADFLELAASQNNCCFICEKEFESLCIDHEHVKGWKKMPPSERKKYVRGLVCIYDNFRLLPKGMTLAKARRIIKYLERYQGKAQRLV